MEYFHVDVFSNKILAGNGLTIVFCDKDLESSLMLKLTQEFKQFETIFLMRAAVDRFKARIFTVEEELDFAGHPILGATAAVHSHFFKRENVKIEFHLNNTTVEASSKKIENYYEVQMNQGQAQFICKVPAEKRNNYLRALNLAEENLSNTLPLEVVSTGLPYLLVPLCSGIENAKISCCDFENMLQEIGAKFVYVFDVNGKEGRTWDNQGNVEDVATGSAAGPLGAYLYKHNVVDACNEIIIHQGRFVGRPSVIKVSMNSKREMSVAGNVAILAKGSIIIE